MSSEQAGFFKFAANSSVDSIQIALLNNTWTIGGQTFTGAALKAILEPQQGTDSNDSLTGTTDSDSLQGQFGYWKIAA